MEVKTLYNGTVENSSHTTTIDMHLTNVNLDTLFVTLVDNVVKACLK